MSKRKGRKPPLTSEIKSVMRAPRGQGKELEPSMGTDEAPSEDTEDEPAAAPEADPVDDDEPESGPAEVALPSPADNGSTGGSDTQDEPVENLAGESQPPAPQRGRRLHALRERGGATSDDAEEPLASDDVDPGARNGRSPSSSDTDGAALDGEDPEVDGDDTGVYGAFSLEGIEGDDTEGFLRGLVEALLFTSQKPLDLKEIARSAGIDKPRAKELVEQLQQSYEGRGLCIEEVAGGFVMRSSPRYAPHIQKILSLRPVRLSRAQLETLAIVAYRQPVTKPEVDDIRGVDSGQVIKGLLERSLLKMLGKKDEPGRPTLYGTTNDFLELLNLQSLKDLPTLREYTELSEESQRKFLEETGEAAPSESFSFERPDRGAAGASGDVVEAQLGPDESVPGPEAEARGMAVEDEDSADLSGGADDSSDARAGEPVTVSEGEDASDDEGAEVIADVEGESSDADDESSEDEDESSEDEDEPSDDDDDDDDDER